MPERDNPDIANYILSRAFGDSGTPASQVLDAFSKAADDQMKRKGEEFMQYAENDFRERGGRFITLQNDPAVGYREEVMLSPDLTKLSLTSVFNDSVSPYLYSRSVELKLEDGSLVSNPVQVEFNQTVRETSRLGFGGRTSLKVVTIPGIGAGLDICLERFALYLEFIAHFSDEGELGSLSFPGYSMSEKRQEEVLEEEAFERENPPTQTIDAFMDKTKKRLEILLEQDPETFKRPFVRMQLVKEAGVPLDALIFLYRDFALFNFENLEDVWEQITEREYLFARSRKTTIYDRNLAVWLGKRNLGLQYADVDGLVGIRAVVPLKIPASQIGRLLNSPTRDWVKVKDYLPFKFAIPAFGIEIDNTRNHPPTEKR